jgi:ubiquitin-activating enzyme E1 C
MHASFKVMSFASQSLNSYMMYMGASGVYTHTFEYERKSECLVCQSKTKVMEMSVTATLQDLQVTMLEDASM